MTVLRLATRWLLVAVFLALPCLAIPSLAAANGPAKVYVVLWFDTEDYILPASDDAALRLAEFLSREGIRATFKVVGEKARTLKRRERYDVIEALKKHEIGYHANWHSVQPSPAMYLSDLGWDEGVAEFERREGPGRDDVEKIFGQTPTCYGQPGSSWAPQSFGAMRRWQMPVYLDAGSHVGLADKPHYYCGVLTLYKLAHTLRTGLTGESDLRTAEDDFQSARQALRAEGGGVVSIFYHPCEFVHKEFWDGVNFRAGANPPRDKWKLPPTKTPEESAVAWRTFEGYIRFIRGFDDVRFVTASEAARLYRDRARGRRFAADEIKTIAASVTNEVTFQQHEDFALSASETFALLNEFVARGEMQNAPLELLLSPLGPTEARPALAGEQTVDWSQFSRTARDVADFVERQNRIPSTVWLGSTPVPPDSYLVALAEVATALAEGHKPPDSVTLRPARLSAAAYVSDDRAGLWGWVIFPPGFHAPAMMELAKRQAWTIKPALLAE
ncbi:MAG TPA: hypothetical protein VG125_30515 [Pirellulales bacterium]|jgi:hypothetical protein|nr:hypothetical protein [Pirellulales bacterium]